MKIKNILGVKIFGLVILSLLLAVNCAEKGTDPEPNNPPNTLITGFHISATPDSGTYFTTSIFWSSSDQDGDVSWYYWKIAEADGDSVILYDITYVIDEDGDTTSVDTTTTNLSEWQASRDISTTLSLDYPTFDMAYVFDVKAQDNDRDEDLSPATDVISMDRIKKNLTPETNVTTGPPNGATTGTGIYFMIQGTDYDGTVESIEYKIDTTGAAWTSIAADFNTAAIIVRDLPVGAQTLLFRAVDNYGDADPTPKSASFIVDSTLEPEVVLSVKNNQAFIVPYHTPQLEELTISIIATVDFYYSAIDSFVIITSEGDTVNTTEPEFTFTDLGSGAYWLKVTAYDIGGNSTAADSTNFSVVELPQGDGLLCVNGVDWGSYGQAPPMWDDGVPWGNRTHFKCWDLFDTTPFGSVPDFADSLLGTGSIPEWMFDTDFFDAICWFGNNYSGDFAFWEEREEAIMAYLEMGGNLLLPTRLGSTFFFDELATYAGIVEDSWVSPGADILTAKVGILDDILAEQGQSLWEIPMTDNPDNVWIYEAASVAPGLHAGFVTLPLGEGGGGAFCYIAGRSYRWDNPSLKAAVDVIMETYFGIAN